MAQGSGGLSRELRELSEKLGAAHESATAKQEAATRNQPSARKIQARLFAIVFGLITVETLAGFLFFGFPGFAIGARNASGLLAYLIPAAMFGLTLLITLVILAAARMQRRERGRLPAASASGVVTGTDIVQSTLATGKVGYLIEVSYVYEVGREKYTGAWRPAQHRAQGAAEARRHKGGLAAGQGRASVLRPRESGGFEAVAGIRSARNNGPVAGDFRRHPGRFGR